MKLKIIFLAYLLFYFFAPTNYTMSVDMGGPGHAFQGLMYFLPFLLIIPVSVPRIAYLLSPITRNVTLWIMFCLVGMIIGVVGNTFDLVAWFFSWKTFGFMFASVLFCINRTKDVFIRAGGYVWYAIGSIWLAIGLSELVNNAEMLWFHNYWNDGMATFFVQEVSDYMWFMAGLIVILLFYRKHKDCFHITKGFWWICIIGIVAYGIISLYHYPVGIYYDKGEGPYYQDLNYWFWVLSHVIRIWYLLPAFLVLGRKNIVRSIT